MGCTPEEAPWLCAHATDESKMHYPRQLVLGNPSTTTAEGSSRKLEPYVCNELEWRR